MLLVYIRPWLTITQHTNAPPVAGYRQHPPRCFASFPLDLGLRLLGPFLASPLDLSSFGSIFGAGTEHAV
jgi:hypothetical protein